MKNLIIFFKDYLLSSKDLRDTDELLKSIHIKWQISFNTSNSYIFSRFVLNFTEYSKSLWIDGSRFELQYQTV